MGRGRGDLKQQVLAVLLASDTPLTPGQVREALDAELAYTTVMKAAPETPAAHARPRSSCPR
jgi:hypothetical protein